MVKVDELQNENWRREKENQRLKQQLRTDKIKQKCDNETEKHDHQDSINRDSASDSLQIERHVVGTDKKVSITHVLYVLYKLTLPEFPTTKPTQLSLWQFMQVDG